MQIVKLQYVASHTEAHMFEPDTNEGNKWWLLNVKYSNQH